MKQFEKCPECSAFLFPNIMRCRCGWKQKLEHSPGQTSYLCQYRHGERKCPLPGTISFSLKGQWYCPRHNKTIKNPVLAETELNFIEKNYQKIMQEEYGARNSVFFKNDETKN